MSININSEAECSRAYANYYYRGNSLEITKEEIKEIENKWSGKISSWKASMEKDENEYEIDDEARTRGENAGREATDDYDRKDGDRAKSISTTAVAAGALATTAIASLKASSLGKAGGPLGWIAAGLQAALAVLYWATRPNKEGNEAANQMNNELANAQGALGSAQEEMLQAEETSIQLAEQAEDENEAANDKIETSKTGQDFYLISLRSLEEKAKNGGLTPEEKAFYNNLVKQIGNAGTNIQETVKDTSETVNGLYEEMGEVQEVYDYALETTEEAQGMTDYAESFDTATKNSANLIGGMMYANATISTIVGGALLLDPNIFTKAVSLIFSGIALGAAVSHGKAGKEQFEIAKNVGNEIETREATEEINTETVDAHSVSTGVYESTLSAVEDLTIEEPTELKVPAQTSGSQLQDKEARKPKEEENKTPQA